MVYTIRDVIGWEGIKSGPDSRGRWSRSVPVRYYGGYVAAAWAVLTGRAVALRYPESGELEQALQDTGGIRVDPKRSSSEDHR